MATPPPSFELTHRVVKLANIESLQLHVELQLALPEMGEWVKIPFRVDTGADVSLIPGNLWNPAIQSLTNWSPGVDFRTASGTVLPTRRAIGVRFRFLPLLSETFRTDFSVATTVASDYGLLAWRDLALDFDIHTAHRPRTYPDGSALAFPGVLRLTLRPDRFPARVG